MKTILDLHLTQRELELKLKELHIALAEAQQDFAQSQIPAPNAKLAVSANKGKLKLIRGYNKSIKETELKLVRVCGQIEDARKRGYVSV